MAGLASAVISVQHHIGHCQQIKQSFSASPFVGFAVVFIPDFHFGVAGFPPTLRNTCTFITLRAGGMGSPGTWRDSCNRAVMLLEVKGGSFNEKPYIQSSGWVGPPMKNLQSPILGV